MAKLLKKRTPLIYPDSVRPPPTLPDAESVLKLGLSLSEQELMVVRMGMAIHSASRQPKLTWSGWRHIAVACAIGAEHIKKKSGGQTDTPTYIRAMSDFLKSTGFVFLNKDDRACAVRMLPIWSDIDAWRSSLPNVWQQRLNNPREVEREYNEHRKKLGDPNAKKRPAGNKQHQFPSLLEQYEALAQQLAMAEERAERAEHEAGYFAAMAKSVQEKAGLDDDTVAEIRAKVRASLS